MKKLYSVILFMVCAHTLFAQNKTIEDLKVLIGATLKVKPLPDKSQENGYDGFYKKLPAPEYINSVDNNQRKLLGDGKISHGSKYEALVGKEFKCVDILHWTDKSRSEDLALVLQSNVLGTVYYDYDVVSDYGFTETFEILGNSEYTCNKLVDETDKFTNERTIRTPITEDISFIKRFTNGEAKYEVYLQTVGELPNEGKGVSILFKDKSQITLPLLAETSYVRDTFFIHSALFTLTDEQIEKFKNSIVTDFRLYLYDKKVEASNAEKIKAYFDCLLNKK